MRPDDKMPYTIDEFGNKITADIIMDPASLVSRMNIGRLYEQYFNAMSRKCQAVMRSKVKNINNPTDKEVNECFDILLGLLEIIGTEQFVEYSKVKNDKVKKREIVSECLLKEVFILYRVSSEKQPWQIVLDTKNTIYYPAITPVYMKKDDGKIIEFKNKIRIAPVYEILLNKTGTNYLAVSTAKVNHYGILISNSSGAKNINPWSDNAVKSVGETESRLFNAYGNRRLLAELKDRNCSIETHKHIYSNILESDVPTNIDHVVDRNIVPYGDDSSLQLINNLFNAFGLKIDYTDIDKH